MKHDIAIFVYAVIKILGIEKPVDIRMHSKATGDTFRKSIAAYAETHNRKNKIIKHVLHINLDVCVQNEYTIPTTIAHELVHSIMLERGVFNEKKHHCNKFQSICKILKRELRKIDMPVGVLFDPKVDND
jgi:hypothetical protein